MTASTIILATSETADSADYSQLALLTIFILSVFLGFEVISKVSAILHTPLMSGANAIHGIVLVGAILVTANATTAVEIVIGTLAIVLAAINLVGGFVVTDRMLEMFKSKPGEGDKK
ncbi:MAG: NAD(P) transhydrogenase subunit alpha [Actinobacteria bacterium]|nr:NAD(P) transhydrogenase subunit alpha [Actinomycetota bacterium]